MDESTYHALAEKWLTTAEDVLEAVEDFEVEHQYGVLTVILPSGKTFVINKQTPARQLWYSSPISGGLHFSYNAQAQQWTLSDGRELGDIFAKDLAMLGGVVLSF